jgi:Sulfotransferase domain
MFVSGATGMSLVTGFKRILPPAVRHVARKTLAKGSRYTQGVNKHVRRYTGVLPDFLIIGSQKCGTTSLYHYLIQHPCIYPAATKEVGYFDRYYSGDLHWYRSHFPSSVHKYYQHNLRNRPFLTGEASTGYIVIPQALQRIAHIMPHIKLILLLRNPVDRAYSHYHHSRRRGRERCSFEEALQQETARIGQHWQHMRDEGVYSLEVDYYAYRRLGIYLPQVQVLLSLFPREQVVILDNEQLARRPEAVFTQVVRFLELPPWQLRHFERHNSGSYVPMAGATRARLVEYYQPYNQALYAYLGMEFAWDR